MNKKTKPLALEYIQWEDAQSRPEWMTIEDINKWMSTEGFLIEEVGYVVYEDKTSIVVANQRTNQTEFDIATYGNTTRIPKTWILKRKKIKV